MSGKRDLDLTVGKYVLGMHAVLCESEITESNRDRIAAGLGRNLRELGGLHIRQARWMRRLEHQRPAL